MPLGFQEAEDLRFEGNRHMVGRQTYTPTAFTPQETFLVP